MFTRYARHVLAPFVYVLSAFEHHGAHAQLDETQGRKESCRTRPDDNGLRSAFHVGILHLLESGLRHWLAHIGRERQVDVNVSLAGVYAATCHTHAVHSGGLHAKFARHGLAQRALVGRYVWRQTELEGMLHPLYI